MEEEVKTYKVSLETAKMYSDYAAYNNTASGYMNMRWFTHRLVCKTAKKAEWCRQQFWQMATKENPEIANKSATYNSITQTISLTK